MAIPHPSFSYDKKTEELLDGFLENLLEDEDVVDEDSPHEKMVLDMLIASFLKRTCTILLGESNEDHEKAFSEALTPVQSFIQRKERDYTLQKAFIGRFSDFKSS